MERTEETYLDGAAAAATVAGDIHGEGLEMAGDDGFGQAVQDAEGCGGMRFRNPGRWSDLYIGQHQLATPEDRTMTDITAVTHPMIHIAPKDLSVDFMSAIFGPVVDAIRNSGSAGGAQFTAATAGDSLLGSMMQVMNETMLFLAALYIVYITITHSLRLGEQPTGSEGMQIRGSSLWAPVRIPLAVSALLPYAGGYSFLQLLVLWLALNSVGAADALSGVLVQRLPASVGQVTARLESDADTRKTVEQLMAMHVCVNAYNKMASRSRGNHRGEALMSIYKSRYLPAPLPRSGSGDDGRGLLGRVYDNLVGGLSGLMEDPGESVSNGAADLLVGSGQSRSSGLVQRTGGVVYSAGIKDGPPDLQEACGSYQASSALVKGEPPSVGGFIGRLFTGGRDKEMTALREVYAAQRQAFAQTHKEIAQVVHDAVWKGKPYPRDIINTLSARYRARIESAANRALAHAGDPRSRSLESDSRSRGWLLAGAYPIGVLARQSRIQSALDDLPRVVESAQTPNWQTLPQRVGATGSVAQAMMSDYARFRAVVQYAHQHQTDALSAVERHDAPRDLGAKILSRLFSGSRTDPLISVALAGRQILDHAVTLAGGWALTITGGQVVSGLTEAKSAGGLLKGLLKSAGGAALSPAIAIISFIVFFFPLLIAGAMMAYAVPLIPVIIWVGAVASWIVLLIEAVIACVVWAVSWMHPQGDTPVGRGATGWLLILGVLLRPSLMLCGLAAGILLSSVGFILINALFAPAFAAITGNGGLIHSMSQIAGTIMMILLYVGLVIVNIRSSYALIHIVPDKILRWLNAGVETLGAVGHDQVLGVLAGAGGTAGAMAGRVRLPK